MDKVAEYKKIVGDIIQEVANMTPSDETSETQLIADWERGHFILFSVGWYNNKREYLPFVHIDVKPDGKIWIQHDGTDLVLAQWLLDKGVPKKDIVLAFHAPARRDLIPDFATM
ncbi:MAG: XisI protein [Leadbetterella sp.]|nr:XisI protein [Leadbetterella sp.]